MSVRVDGDPGWARCRERRKSRGCRTWTPGRWSRWPGARCSRPRSPPGDHHEQGDLGHLGHLHDGAVQLGDLGDGE